MILLWSLVIAMTQLTASGDLGTPDLAPLKKDISQAAELNIDPMRVVDAHYFLGKYGTDDKETHFESAARLAEKIISTDPKNRAALLAWCAAQGEIAQMANPFRALGLIKPIESRFHALKAIDPAYSGFVADRALGRLYQLAPSFISIGSTEKARVHFQAALAGDPNHPGNQVYWAEFLLAEGDRAEAHKFARMALSNPRLPTSSLERFDWASRANVILEKTHGSLEEKR